MRLGTANTYDNSLENLTTRQIDLAASQEQLTSGKKVARASDDPVAASQAERAITRIERVKVEQRALAAQRDTMGQIESTLGTATTTMQRFRELTVQAGNAALSGTDRSSLVQEMLGLRDQLLKMANTTDISGQPVFAGLGSNGSPFLDNVTSVSFKGISGQVAATEVTVPLVMDGHATFEEIPKDNGFFNIKGQATATGQIWTDLGQVTNAGVSFTASATTFAAASFSVDGNAVTLNGAYGSATAVATAIQAALPSGYTVTASGNSYSIRNTLSAANAISGSNASATAAGILNVPGNVDYKVQFTTTGTSTTYTVDRVSPAASIVTAQPFVSGQTISFTDPLDSSHTYSFTASGGPKTGDALTLGSSATARPLAQTKANIFEVLDTLIAGINGSPSSKPGLTQTVQDALSQLDAGLNRIGSARTQAGAWLNRADTITGAQDSRSLQLEGERSRAEDLDMVKSISDFQNKQIGYEAALKSYSQVQKLSLFNYIS